MSTTATHPKARNAAIVTLDHWLKKDVSKEEAFDHAIAEYLSLRGIAVAPESADNPLEQNPVTLRWWCQQLLDIIENYGINHDSCEEEIAMINDIRAAVDPAAKVD